MLKGVITDLDDTLINSKTAHELSLNNALERNGLPKIKKWAYGTTTEDLTKYNFPDISQEVLKKVAEIKKKGMINYTKFIKPVSGARELIDFLKSQKLKLALLTNNTHAEIKVVLSYLGWENVFDAVVGKEDVKPKPSPEPTLIALEKLGFAKEDVIYLGDSNPDLDSAHGAGVKVMLSQAVHNTERAEEADFIAVDLHEAKQKIREMMLK